MPLSIDQTLHGVLLAAKWVTEAGLKEHDDEWWRNHLILFLHEHVKPGSINYQAFPQNDVLIENAAVVIFLMQAMGYTQGTLKTMTPADQRTAIISHDEVNTGFPKAPVLQALSNRQLVRLALAEYSART
jgi:hypothetical protein